MKRGSAWAACLLAASFLPAIPQSAVAIVGPTVSCSGATCTATFSDTSSVYSWNIPDGVSTITVDVKGAKGGTGYTSAHNAGGLGGRVTGTINVSGVSVINIYVGAMGDTTPGISAGRSSQGGVSGGTPSGGLSPYVSNPYIGGGGGGLSRIVNASNAETILVAAGGGGGGSYAGSPGGGGGSATWSSNVANGVSVGRDGTSGSWGGGGGSTTGGLGGQPNESGGWGDTGTALVGGRGGYGASVASGGGGGGGWFGGGGGGGDSNSSGDDAAGGGGGSNYYNSAYFSTIPTTYAPSVSTSGSVTITYPNVAGGTVTASSSFSYRTPASITYSTNAVAGKVTFMWQKTVMAGCKNRALTADNSYSFTCSWSPALMGPVTLTITFIPTDIAVPIPSPKILQVTVTKRTNLR